MPNTKHIYAPFLNIWSVVLALSLFSFNMVQANTNTVGVIKFARGTVAAQQQEQAIRLLGKGSEVLLGDNIQTSEKSFAIIAFNDQSKITIRPESSFSINEYINNPNNKKASFQLDKGGIKADTGKIAQQKPDNFVIQTGNTTIKAQQAEYAVRICNQDCAEENGIAPSSATGNTTPVVARIVEIQGEVTAQDKTDTQSESRKLALGGPVYKQDHIKSAKDSFALLVFRDESRITLQENSEFEIKTYEYKNDVNDKAVYKLITGGLRALTGTIGKVKKENYRIDTPVATIGIRGTGFDLYYAGNEADTDQLISANEDPCLDKKTAKDGLYSHVWNSAITLTNKTGSYQLDQSQTNYIQDDLCKPKPKGDLTSEFLNNHTLRPDQFNAEQLNLFTTTALDDISPGVYVSVQDGHVKIENTITGSVDLGKNEVAYIDLNDNTFRLEQPQGFQLLDPYPIDLGQGDESGKFSLLNENPSNTAFQCTAN